MQNFTASLRVLIPVENSDVIELMNGAEKYFGPT
jgi:hypothetical protein